MSFACVRVREPVGEMEILFLGLLITKLPPTMLLLPVVAIINSLSPARCLLSVVTTKAGLEEVAVP